MGDTGEGEVPELHPVVKIGGTAMLGTTLVCAATVAIGKNQIAQRAAKKGEKIDVAEMNEGKHTVLLGKRLVYRGWLLDREHVWL